MDGFSGTGRSTGSADATTGDGVTSQPLLPASSRGIPWTHTVGMFVLAFSLSS